MDITVADLKSPEGVKKLEPLTSALSEMGASSSAEEIVLLAQKDPRTAGKSPQEIADMLRSDNALLSDLEGRAPGGAISNAYADMGVVEDSTTEETEAEPSKEAEDEMSGFLAGSESMKGKDPKKAAKAAKGKSPKDMNFDEMAGMMTDLSK